MKRADGNILILLVSPSEQDHSDLVPTCNRFGRTSVAQTCAEATRELAAAEVGVIICEARLPDGSWKDVLELGQNQSRPPHLIVTSSVADEDFWSEVLNLGGYDVLAKPFRDDETTRVINFAAEHWQSASKGDLTPLTGF